mgnify:CR=1 FL=1
MAAEEYIDTAFTEEKDRFLVERGKFDKYNYDIYEHIVHDKSSYLSVYQPLAIAKIMVIQ